MSNYSQVQSVRARTMLAGMHQDRARRIVVSLIPYTRMPSPLQLL